MLGRGGRADKRIAATVAYILKRPASTVPQAMRACKFSDKESKHTGMQMAVRRAPGKGRCVDKRIERTVVHLLWCPASKVPEAMRDDEVTTTPLVFIYPS